MADVLCSGCCLVQSERNKQVSDRSGEAERTWHHGTAQLAAPAEQADVKGQAGRQPTGCLGESQRVSGAQLKAVKGGGGEKEVGRICKRNFGKEEDDCCPEGEVVVKCVCS